MKLFFQGTSWNTNSTLISQSILALNSNCFFKLLWNISVKEIFSFQKLKILFSEILFQKRPPHASLILLFWLCKTMNNVYGSVNCKNQYNSLRKPIDFNFSCDLKELRNPILRIILVWSLFCLNGFMQVCPFYLFLFFWKTNFLSSCAFCLFCFELSVLNQGFNICVIII